MYPDGLCRLDDTTWSRCLEFEDVNYQLAKPDDQTAIFEALCDMYNAHDASIGMELSLVCRKVNKADFRKRIEIAAQEDKFDTVRALYTDMLRGQLEHGNNGMVKTKFLVLTIEAKNSKEAKARFSRIMLDALNYFKAMGALAKVLDGKEWLAVLHGILHPDGDPFSFAWEWLAPSGLSVKDFIAPSSFRFGEARRFQMGSKVGAVNFLQITAPELNDRVLADLLDTDSSIFVSVHIRSMDQNEAIKTVKRKITDLDSMKIDAQKRAAREGFDMDIIPTDIATYAGEAKNILRDLQSRNERMFLMTFLVVNVADTKVCCRRPAPSMRKRRDTRMKHNFMTKMVSALLAVVLSTAAFSVTAFASGGEETTEPVAEQETAGDVSDLLSALAGSQVTVSVTEDGIQFSSGENDSEQTGTVTTGGGNLNVRTGAGMDYTAFTQLPNGTTVKVIGTDGDWLKVILPEKIGYVYSGYMTVSDGEAGSGEGSFSLDVETLENLLGMLGGGLNGGAALTPDGNLSLIDDIGSPTASGKQFITVETKNGNVFYLIIDRDDEGEETVHFLNQVDEADLMALTEDGEKAETPIVCTCTEKCQAGAVNTACPVCVKNLSECVGTEQKAAEPTEPENPEPEKKSNAGAILAVLLILAAGGGAAVYFLVLKPKQGKKVPADLDDFDLEDEEEYLTEDEETEEKNE